MKIVNTEKLRLFCSFIFPAGMMFVGAQNAAASYPAMGTDGPTAVTETSANVRGYLSSMGGAPSVSVRFGWDTVSHASDGAYSNFTPITTVTNTGEFSQAIAGLSPSQTYYYQVQVTNSTVAPLAWVPGHELGFRTEGTPIISTQFPNTVTQTTANLLAYFSNLGGVSFDSMHFVYDVISHPSDSTGASYAYSTPIVAVSTLGNITEVATGLSAGTQYFCRVVATNSLGFQAVGNETYFRTMGAPTVATEGVAVNSASGSTLKGTLGITGGASVVSVYFQYGVGAGGTGSTYEFTSSAQNLSAAGNFTQTVTSLLGHTRYHFRAVATSSMGTQYGADETFTTPLVYALATTGSVTGITSTSATITVNLTSLGGDSAGNTTLGYMLYSTADSRFEAGAGSGIIGAGLGQSSWNLAIGLGTNLLCNTAYSYQATADNSAGRSFGNLMSFTTAACP